MMVKQNLSILFFLSRKRARKKDGKAPVYVRLTIDGLNDTISTGIMVHPERLKNQESTCTCFQINRSVLFSRMRPTESPTNTELEPLLNLFNALHPIGKRVDIYLQKNIYCCAVKKGDFLVKAGEVCDSIYFIRKGVLRGFITEDDKDITTWLTIENEVVATITGFLLQ